MLSSMKSKPSERKGEKKRRQVPRNVFWRAPDLPSTRTPPCEWDLSWPAASHPRVEPVRRTDRRRPCRCRRVRLLRATSGCHCTASTSASSFGHPRSIRNRLQKRQFARYALFAGRESSVSRPSPPKIEHIAQLQRPKTPTRQNRTLRLFVFNKLYMYASTSYIYAQTRYYYVVALIKHQINPDGRWSNEKTNETDDLPCCILNGFY